MRIKWTEVKLGELQRRLDRGLSPAEIARMMHLPRSNIYWVIKKYGLKIKST